MRNGNGFALSGKHEVVFMHMGVQSFPMTLQPCEDSCPGMEAGTDFRPARTTTHLSTDG